MSEIRGFGIPFARPARGQPPEVTHVVVQHPLRRVLSFTGHTIDDVVNDPIVKNKVRGVFQASQVCAAAMRGGGFGEAVESAGKLGGIADRGLRNAD